MNDTVTLSRDEYQNLIDVRDHAIAMRGVASGAMETIPADQVDAYLAAATPLAFWRKYRGLTQAKLASDIGITQPSLARAEKEGQSGLTVANLAKAARTLRVRMEDLISEE